MCVVEYDVEIREESHTSLNFLVMGHLPAGVVGRKRVSTVPNSVELLRQQYKQCCRTMPTKRARDDDDDGAAGGTASPAPERLWSAVLDSASWSDLRPPYGHRFLAALQLRQTGMKRPAPDLLFGSGDTVKHSPSEVPEFPSSSYLGSQWDPNNTALAASTHQLVVLLMRWKLQRGVFRPGLLQQVQSNSPADVLMAIHKAHSVFEEAAASSCQGNARLSWGALGKASIDAVKHLCCLRGVGPATASLILSRFVLDGGSNGISSTSVVSDAHSLPTGRHLLIAPSEVDHCPAIALSRGIVPFFADEAAAIVLQVPANKLKYTVSELSQFMLRVWDKYEAILRYNAQEPATATTEIVLQPADISHCLWAATVLHKHLTATHGPVAK